ncbi:MAG: hypothetical protein LBI61_01290 [Puniceicoccales bacterium]|nr:hypothetical protein [Puniceicoccales bacterium]
MDVFAENMENECCWQFIIKWCDKIQHTDTYDREKKRNNLVVLPVLGDVLVRCYETTGEIEINIDSRFLARQLVRAMEEIIWKDGEHHFEEVAIYDLNPLADIG